MQLYNNDCFNVLQKLNKKSIDLVVVDLPYGQTSCKWDCLIDLDKMWIELKRICKKKCVYVFFCTTKFGISLINSKPNWFKYDLVWEKSRKVGFLSANKMPLRKHEMIYIFGSTVITNTNDLKNERNKDMREYAKMIYKKIGKTKKQIYKDMGNQKLDHFFRFNSTQFKLPTKEVYGKMIEFYKLDIKKYEELTFEQYDGEYEDPLTYNPQKTEGNPYKCKQGKQKETYGIEEKERVITINKGDRHPTSILKYPEPDHEMVYIFGNNEEDKSNQFKELREYFNKIIKKDMDKIGDVSHYITKGKQFRIPTEKKYNLMILKYKINELDYFIPYKKLKEMYKQKPTTYNPQKKEGKPYKTKESSLTKSYYRDGKEYKSLANVNKGDRYPSTILKFNNPSKSVHRTQKPVDLCEWLIKSYSNEGDTVLDFTMGSGTTGVACKNINRKFIGIEMDEDIFKIAKERIET